MIDYVSRKIEEEYLSDCDDSCINPNCVCVQDFSTTKKGKALSRSKFCILCLRKNNRADYTNFVTDYDMKCFHSTYPFIKFNREDYEKVHDTQIVQKFEPGNYERETVLSMGLNRFNFDNLWEFTYCDKHGILSFIDSQFSIGSGDVLYDFQNSKLICKKCSVPIKKLYPDSENIVHFQGKNYTSCMICESITEYNVWDTPQTCLPCKVQINEIIEENKKICEVCHKRGNVVMTENGMFLCKIHKRSMSKKRKI